MNNNTILLWIPLLLILCLNLNCHLDSKDNLIYEDKKVWFSYPHEIERAPKDLILSLRQQLESQPNIYIGRLVDLEMFILDPENVILLTFNKANVSKLIDIDSLYRQRKQMNLKALNNGYIKNMKTLEITIINNIPFLIEDFIANTGTNFGRSYSVRTIANSSVYEFTVAGLNVTSFNEYKELLDKIIESFVVKD